jgi:endonuclease YncB( thermonuclease family)
MKIKLSIALLLIFGVVIAEQDKASNKSKVHYGSVSVSKVISVYDGDTFRVNIDSLPPLVGQNIAIRINGVDTPEIKGKCSYEKDLALKARDFVRSKLETAKTIRLTEIQRGKYFRIIASVEIDGASLGSQLLRRGLAYKYYGGKKLSWCK